MNEEAFPRNGVQSVNYPPLTQGVLPLCPFKPAEIDTPILRGYRWT